MMQWFKWIADMTLKRITGMTLKWIAAMGLKRI